jgi:hypothetical protein
MTYGYEVHQREDRILGVVKRMNKFKQENIIAGQLLVNHIPFCMNFRFFSVTDRFTKYTPVRHIPEWLPWLSYKPLARIGHNLGNEVVYTPLQFVKESIVSSHLSGRITTSQVAQNTIIVAEWHGASLACSRAFTGGGGTEIKWI